MQVIISAHDYRVSVPRIYCRLKVSNIVQDVYYDRLESKWNYSEPKKVDVDFDALENELKPLVYYEQLEHNPQGRLSSIPLDDVTMDDIAECRLHIGPKQMAELQAMVADKPRK